MWIGKLDANVNQVEANINRRWREKVFVFATNSRAIVHGD
jgi:hypothetical protein